LEILIEKRYAALVISFSYVVRDSEGDAQ
jgi:hypothetical protein